MEATCDIYWYDQLYATTTIGWWKMVAIINEPGEIILRDKICYTIFEQGYICEETRNARQAKGLLK